MVTFDVPHFGLRELRCPRDDGEMERERTRYAIRCTTCGFGYAAEYLYFGRAPYGPWPFNFRELPER